MDVLSKQPNARAKVTMSQRKIKIDQYSKGYRSHEVGSISHKPPEPLVQEKRGERFKKMALLLTSMKFIRRGAMRHYTYVLFPVIWVIAHANVWIRDNTHETLHIQPFESYVVLSDNIGVSSPAQTRSPQRIAGLLQFSTMTNENHDMDSYSGMWWLRRDVFVSRWNATLRCRNYEGASFKLFNKLTNENIYLTKDWLDFSVEHLSHYFKLLDIESLPTFEGMIKKYVQRPVKKYSKTGHSVFHDTLAVLPVYFSDSETTCDWDASLKNLDAYENKLSCLYMYSLSATLKSLWQAGIRRVVVAGNFPENAPIVEQAVRTFWSFGPGQDGSNMVVQYVYVSNEGHNNGMPCNTLDQLQSALRYYMTGMERAQWLGQNNSIQESWRYVYFSEPDLILNSRLSALSTIQQALDDGNLVTAHRFQLMKHEIDARPNHTNTYSLFLPNHKEFSEFIDLDSDAGDSCCDAGNWWPGIDDYPKCDNFWYLCGFIDEENFTIDNREEAYSYHQRLWSYPNIRLRNGMNVPVVQAHGRACYPQRDGNGCTSGDASFTTS